MNSALYNAQDEFLKLLGNIPAIQTVGGEVILCGGTALARQYLDHRISYDLDFFVSNRFNPNKMLTILGANGIQLRDIQIENDIYVSQCLGFWSFQGQKVKISFIEDSFPDMFKLTPIKFTNTLIRTEELNGLYHRKLRTITGVSQGDVPQGGRQMARDLFDLYVLDMKLPIPQFIEVINENGANFPVKAFSSGLGAMQWLDLVTEFEDIEYNADNVLIKNLDFIRGIMGEIRYRMSDVINEININGKNFKP